MTNPLNTQDNECAQHKENIATQHHSGWKKHFPLFAGIVFATILSRFIKDSYFAEEKLTPLYNFGIYAAIFLVLYFIFNKLFSWLYCSPKSIDK